MKRPLALITGGTSGIGFAVAKALASSHNLALSFASNKERAGVAEAELRGAGREIRTYGGALFSYEDAQNLVQKVNADFHASPSILVHCAGRTRDALFLKSNFEDHLKIIQEHLCVGMALARLTLEPMYKERFGRFIFMSSISARQALRGQTSYAAAKAAIEGFARVLALEVAHRGITVNTIAPGMVETPMTVSVIKRMEANQTPIGNKVPVGFCGQPHDVAALVKFLCSEEARYITGTVIPVDGGRTAGDPLS